MVKVLIVAPDFDLATRAWHPWLLDYLRPQLESRGVEVVAAEGGEAVRERVWQILSDPEVKALFGCGHGDDKTFTGQQLDEIFVACKYPEELVAGKCFAPVSCLVGRKLLPDMVEKGLGCGLGETVIYVFYLQPGVPPLEDWILALFTKSEFTYAICMAEGCASGEAHARMIKAYYDSADRVREIDPEIAYTLEYDADYRLHFGDAEWRLVEAPPPPPGKYVCPWCEWSTDSAEEMRLHVWNMHVWPELQPCILPRFLRRLLGCPLKK